LQVVPQLTQRVPITGEKHQAITVAREKMR